MKRLSFVLCFLSFSVFAAEPMTVTLTFDDGVKGHLLLAAPAIESNGWHGTFNIVTDWVGVKGECLTWDEVRELRRRGHEIASHTATHPHLRDLYNNGKTNEVRRELVEARDRLTKELGVTPRFMCLPYSQTTREVNALSRSLGQEPMVLERFNVGNNVTPEKFAKQLDAWIASGLKRKDLLFHGITPETGGWRPFAKVEEFDACIAAIREREQAGKLKVVSYAEFLGISK